ncbi:TSUP family transporter [Dysosmobacter sp.]|uniref:TSUP family transporter n=1 Tax=Dysosmobacter sp. TaxID=2591382 RepID=UPI002A944524|nr:TSUP family transporter [Dysosmobacter sp.]MDY5612229.1 TSUP family transporter [Dysosmobacter sp.]
MNSKWPARIAGGAAGLANGLFGGGGGMVFLPILSRWGGLSQRKLYATCVGVIFPVCLVSAAVYLFRGGVSLGTTLPYLAGGLIGGFLGGKLYGKVPTKALKWLFAAFLFYAGVKYLL